MAGTNPIESQDLERRAQSLRITLKDPPHRWTFTFESGSASEILKRIEQLERDPDAPLDRAAADVLREQVIDLVGGAGFEAPQVGGPVVPSAPASPFIIQTGKSPRQRCNDD